MKKKIFAKKKKKPSEKEGSAFVKSVTSRR